VDFNKFADPEGDFYVYGFSGIPVYYMRCIECGFLFTAFCDDWSAEDFSQHLYNGDYIKVDGEYASIRPRSFATAMAARFGRNKDARILDYGSGSGVFVGKLRELGFEKAEGYDPFSNPVRPEGKFDIITCLEVMEHSTDPWATVLDMKGLLREDGCILFSQALQPPEIQRLRGNWWYVAPRNGHVSLYTDESLAILAQRCGLAFCPGDGLYGLRGAQLSETASFATRDLGKPLFVLTLRAPGQREGPPHPEARASQDGWQEIEHEKRGRPYRWSSRNRLVWEFGELPAYPCTLRVRMPFVNQIEPGFAAKSRLAIGEKERAPRIGAGTLSADFELTAARDRKIEVRTPDLASPSDRGPSSDTRSLGLAVPVSG
jgi:SAM-dependent methyltransferase